MARRQGKTDPDSQVFEHAAAGVFELIDHMDQEVRAGEATLLARVEAALDQFSRVLARSDLPQPAIAPARLSLAVLIDARARAQPRLKLSSWSVLAQSRLFDGRNMSLAQVRTFAETAHGAGPDYAGLAVFLDHIAGQVQTGGRSLSRAGSNWGMFAVLSVAVFLLALAAYASWLEYRYHARIIDSFQKDIEGVAVSDATSRPDLAEALTRLADARDRVGRAVRHAPFRRVVRLPVVDSETYADGIYQTAVADTGPTTLAAVLEEVLATEGDSLELYDALRAFAVLSGDVDWSPD